MVVEFLLLVVVINASKVVNKGGIAFPAARTPATVAGLLDSAIVADIAVAIAVICVRAAVVIFIPILDGGAIAPDGIKAACNVVKLAVALPKFTVTAAIAGPYPGPVPAAAVAMGIDTVINPLAAIAGGNNTPGILFS